MGDCSNRMAPKRKRTKSGKRLKTYIKFLASSSNPVTTRAVVKDAPESVIKSICNAGLNCYQGEVKLNPSQKKLLSKHRKLFKAITSRTRSLKSKRRFLIQKGGAGVIPLILGAALAALGTRFLK